MKYVLLQKKNIWIINVTYFKNFTIKELEILKTYIFEELLELYDLKWKGFNVENGCNRFHIMPRFCRTLPCKLKLNNFKYLTLIIQFLR